MLKSWLLSDDNGSVQPVIKSFIKKYFDIKSSNNALDEQYTSMRVVKLFSFIGVTLTSILGISALIANNWQLGISLLIASFVFFLGSWLQERTQNIQFASNTILYSLIILLISLVYSGGYNNTGPLWIFIVAPVAFFLHGLKRGALDIGFFTIVISILLFFPNDALLAASYDPAFKTRLLFSFLTITVLSGFYEFSREESYQQAIAISNKFEHLAKFDPLTHLSNRRDAQDKLSYEFHRMQRTSQPVSILLCDLDHFKHINDTYGHAAGDIVLEELAQLFRQQIRAQDTVARWGGEEFLFILPQTDEANALSFAKKLHASVESQTIYHNEQAIKCSFSAGISELNANSSIEESLKRADSALYQAKDAGRNQTYIAEHHAINATPAN